MTIKVIFLDRDGTINYEKKDYVKTPDEFILLPNVENNLKLLTKNGFKLIIISNQSMIGRKISSLESLNKIHQKMQEIFQNYDFQIDKIYCCMHTPEDNCNCRKPKTQLLEDAIKDFDIDLSQSWLIGNSDSDTMSGKKIGCKTIQIPTNGKLDDAVKRILDSELS